MPGTDSITDDLRTDILSGHFPPGDRLQEIALADRYRCGRAAVRASLVELTAEGLVERVANVGARVRRVSIEEAIQITEARAALESLIAIRAATQATESERGELRGIIADMRAAVDEGRTAHYSELNALLHQRIREVSGHAVAADMVGNLRNRAAHHKYRIALMPGRPAQSLEQHAAIVDAIAVGDAARAGEAMHDHLASVIDVLMRWGDAAVVD